MSTPREFVGGRPNRLFFKHILRKIFLEDWFLKLTALVITLGLWYGVSVSSKKGTATMAALLTFRPSDDAVMMSPSTQNVTIRVAGDDEAIGRLFGNEIRLTADLTQEPNGERTLQLTPQSVSTNLPPGVKVEDIQPSRIAVTLEPVQVKDVAVEAALVGEPAPGYEVYSTTVLPARVRIRGPESFMSTLETVPTGPIDIAGAKEELSAKQVPININNPKVAVFNTVADVNILVGEKRIERTFVVATGGKRVAVVLFGAKTPISKIRASDLKVDLVKNDSGQEIPKLNFNDPAIEVRSTKIL